MGDRAWRELLDMHHQAIRRELQRFGGRERGTAGDGFFATFDGPARAVRCALAANDAMVPLGIEVRAGVHTGEVEVVADDVRGSRCTSAPGSEPSRTGPKCSCPQTVKDLTAGSGLTFEDAGEHELKGVPDPWHLYRVVPRMTMAVTSAPRRRFVD